MISREITYKYLSLRRNRNTPSGMLVRWFSLRSLQEKKHNAEEVREVVGLKVMVNRAIAWNVIG